MNFRVQMILDVKGKAHADEIVNALTNLYKESGGVKLE